MYNNYLTRRQMQTIIDNAPEDVKAVPGYKEQLLQMAIDRGLRVEDLNDYPAPGSQFNKGIDPNYVEPKIDNTNQRIAGGVQNARGIDEKILGFTGGDKIAQGLGQALAAPGNNKMLDDATARSMQTQTDLIQRIKEKKARGEDTLRLEKALADVSGNIKNIADETEGVLNPNQLTTKQVLGDTIQLGTTVAGAGALKGAQAGKLAGTEGLAKAAVKSKTIGAGILQGAKTGAIAGAEFGGAQGIAQGLKDDEDALGIVKSGAMGALGGGVGGVVLGGVAGGIGGVVGKAATKKANVHIDAITPKVKDLTESEYQELVRMGKIQSATLTNPPKVIITPEEAALGEKYKPLLGKDPVKNSQNIIDEVYRQDKEVGNFLKKNNGIFNTGELKNSLIERLKDVDDITVSEDRIIKAKNDLINNFVKSLDKNDMHTLWQKRKEFDRLSKAFQGSPTFKKEVAKEFRNAIQDFIADRTPDTVYKDSMKEMSKLLDLEELVRMKSSKQKNYSDFVKWLKDNPGKSKLLWGSVSGLGLAGGAKVVQAFND